jgi:hypothetical protein
VTCLSLSLVPLFCVVHYIGRWKIGEQKSVFDNTYEKARPLEIVVGERMKTRATMAFLKHSLFISLNTFDCY